MAGFILEVQQGAPDEIGAKTAKQKNRQRGQAGPEFVCAGGEGCFVDVLAGLKRESETRAHNAGEGRDQNASFEIEFFDVLPFLFLGHFAFFRKTRQRRDADAEQTNPDACERDLAGVDFVNHARPTGKSGINALKIGGTSVPNAAQ
jgi:hypothetical protein